MAESGVHEKSIKLHWETIEKYYLDRLNSLRQEIDTAMQQNSKLSSARDELVQEILELHQKSKELTIKNDFLSRSIVEKESNPYAYNEQYYPVGVTLEDKPYTPPTPPSPPTTSTHTSITSSNSSEHQQEDNKQPGKNGLFRQISLRLSTKKKRQHDDSVVPENNKKNSTHSLEPIVSPAPSSSEPLLHPAAVVNNEKRSGNKSKHHRRNHSAYQSK